MTLYDDGKSLVSGDQVISRILRLLSSNVSVAIVTAAGYTDASRYHERLLGLLEAIREAVSNGPLKDPKFAVMGGESQYLFVWDMTQEHLLKMVPRSEWKLEIMKSCC